MPKWEPAADRGLWALNDPRLSNLSNDSKEELLWARKYLGQYSSPSLSPLITHTQQHHPFENKVWEIYIFIKKCIRSLLKSSLPVDYVPAYICIYIYIYIRAVVCGYTTELLNFYVQSLTNTFRKGVNPLIPSTAMGHEDLQISFQTFSVWALLLIVHIWNSSPLPSNLLRLQCTCCTVPTTSRRPHGSPIVLACQWPSSQPLSSPQFSHKDNIWA